MDLSKVKLIATDMDGTLLNSNHEVSDVFFQLFEKLKARDIKFVAASGRQYHSILSKLKSIEEDIVIVAENGAFVVENGKELFVNSFEKEQVVFFLNIVQKISNVTIVLAGKKRAYFLEGNPALENFVSEYYSEYQLLESFDRLPEDDILKLALYHPKGAENNIYPYVHHLSPSWQVKISGEFWVDIALPSNHKGNALSRIQKQLNISEEETMAFGDYQNDIEMLKKAKFSFAMENAHQDVKKTASYVAKSNDDLGVETVLSTLLAVKK